jgi:hypothetical protein
MLIDRRNTMPFNPLAITGYLDVADIPDMYEKNSKRDILANVREALKGRKRNRYRHLVIQRNVYGSSLGDWEEKVLVEVNGAMAKLKEEGYTIDDERYEVPIDSKGSYSYNVYRWTILWTEE